MADCRTLIRARVTESAEIALKYGSGSYECGMRLSVIERMLLFNVFDSYPKAGAKCPISIFRRTGKIDNPVHELSQTRSSLWPVISMLSPM